MAASTVDRRVLAGLRFLDRTTGGVILSPLQLSADNTDFIRNISNIFVISRAPGLEAHTREFSQVPSTPALESIDINVSIIDPSGRYHPRLVSVQLPRDADPANSANANSLFQTIDIQLYPTVITKIQANWSVVRGSIIDVSETEPEPVIGALIRIVREADDEVLASGITDERGEVVAIVPGVPITQFSDGEDAEDDEEDEDPVVVSELAVRLELSIDPAAAWPANPDTLEANHAANVETTRPLSLRAGREERVTIELA